MGKYYITFRSVTAAQRAQRLLEGAGYRTALLRTPGMLAEKGCGYSLRLKNVDGVLQKLEGGGLSYGKLYYKSDSGKLVEVAP